METRANNVIGPYKFNQVCGPFSLLNQQGGFTHEYTLNYVSLTDFMDRVKRLEQIAQLPRYLLFLFLLTNLRHVGQGKILQIIGEREASTQFDISWLEHLDEKPLKEVPCMICQWPAYV